MKTSAPDKTVRSQDEILSEVFRLKNERGYDCRNDRMLTLVDYLTIDRVKPLLCDIFNQAQYWKEAPSDVSSVLSQMKDYMQTAWKHADSVWDGNMSRTLHTYAAWAWMTGDDEFANSVVNPNMPCKEILRNICRHYGWDYALWDSKAA